MLLKALVVALVMGAACTQLEQGILAALYYPPPPALPAPQVPPTRSTNLPRPHGALPALLRGPRSYFERDEAPTSEGNDAALRRVLHKMADPHWTPDVRPRSPWA